MRTEKSGREVSWVKEVIVFEGVYHNDRLQNAVLESSGSLNEALCRKQQGQRKDCSCWLMRGWEWDCPRLIGPLRIQQPIWSPEQEKKKKEEAVVKLSGTADQDHYTVWLETQEWTWHYIENTGLK